MLPVFNFADDSGAGGAGSPPGAGAGQQQTATTAPPELPPQGPEDEQEDVSQDVNELLTMLLPWGISILFHVALIMLAIFIVWSVQGTLEDEEVIVPIARLSTTPGAPLQQTVQRQTTTSRSVAVQRSVSRTTQQTTSAVSTSVSTNTQLIGVMGGSMGAAGNPFGAAIAAGSSFKASFYGTGGNARRLVYLVDASGSLIDTLPFVIVELKRSISELSDQQQLSVIFFQEDDAIEVPPPGLKKASSENKEKIIKWISPDAGNVVAKGRSSPINALKRALTFKPQLLFILSDNITGAGIYEVDQKRLLAEVRRANIAATKINTIQFLYPDPLTAAGLEGTLELIAKQTGGEYRFVDSRELNIE